MIGKLKDKTLVMARASVLVIIRAAAERVGDKAFDRFIEALHDDVSAIREASSSGGDELTEEIKRRER